MKTIVFKYTRDFNGHDIVKEEFEFKDDVTEKQINDVYTFWMISQITDSCTWYEKEEK